MFKCAMCNQRKKISWNLLMIPRNVSENLLNFNVKHNEWMGWHSAMQYSIVSSTKMRYDVCMCLYVFLREVKAHARFIHLHMVHIDLCASEKPTIHAITGAPHI